MAAGETDMGTNRRALAVALAALASVLLLVSPARAGFPDVPGGYWAASAIRAVAQDETWMQDYGTAAFRPEELLLRRHLAKALVQAFAPAEPQGAGLTFSDLPSEDPHHPYANVAVKLGWMRADGGTFRPDAQVPTVDLDRALVRALALGPEIEGLNNIQTADGVRFAHGPDFAELVLARQLGLHHNHPTSAEARELLPTTLVRRADAAYALWRAVSARGTSKITALARYRSVVLPLMTPVRRQVVEFALSYAGYPYVYAGEWHTKTPTKYCCGAQAQGGFDCSGFAWWVLRKPGDGWDNTAVRPYLGWRLAERSSRFMAQAASKRLTMKQSRPADLMLFDGDGGKSRRGVDHAGVYLGRGWMIHSSSGRDGVAIDWVKSGWYRDNFVFSRRVVPISG
jgi:cell wall-associated NlpC family hydrolase